MKNARKKNSNNQDEMVKCLAIFIGAGADSVTTLSTNVCEGKYGQDVNTLMLCEGESKKFVAPNGNAVTLDDPIKYGLCVLKDVCTEDKVKEKIKKMGSSDVDMTCTDANVLIAAAHATQFSVATMVVLSVAAYMKA